MKRHKVATPVPPANSVTVYTVGGSIRNRTANVRGKNSAQDWKAYARRNARYIETDSGI